jgi:hypothetical protein
MASGFRSGYNEMVKKNRGEKASKLKWEGTSKLARQRTWMVEAWMVEPVETVETWSSSVEEMEGWHGGHFGII